MVWLSVPAAEDARDRPRREPGPTYRATSVNPPATTPSRRSTITSPPSTMPTPVPDAAGPGDGGHLASAAAAASPAVPPAPSPAPLSLTLPRGLTPPTPPRPAQLALRDPRANAVKLTPEERLAIAAGTIDCVIEERQPDGSVVRGPGRLVSVMAIGTAGMRGETVQMCVR